MLSREDNELLVRVGPGIGMGGVIRCFWIPALLSSEIEERNGRPIRVRLLGEDLIAFRDDKGEVGLLGERCPHRHASLALGANEDGGVRCLYHGWKFAVDGQCFDTPTEPERSTLCKVMRAKAYPVREAAGVVWTYMGAPDKEPPFPRRARSTIPACRRTPSSAAISCSRCAAIRRSAATAISIPWS